MGVRKGKSCPSLRIGQTPRSPHRPRACVLASSIAAFDRCGRPVSWDDLQSRDHAGGMGLGLLWEGVNGCVCGRGILDLWRRSDGIVVYRIELPLLR